MDQEYAQKLALSLYERGFRATDIDDIGEDYDLSEPDMQMVYDELNRCARDLAAPVRDALGRLQDAYTGCTRPLDDAEAKPYLDDIVRYGCGIIRPRRASGGVWGSLAYATVSTSAVEQVADLGRLADVTEELVEIVNHLTYIIREEEE